MLATPNELIARARVYMGDDHDETQGFLAPSSWLALFNVEYQRAYRQWVRSGIVKPAPIDLAWNGPVAQTTATITAVGSWTGLIRARTAGAAGTGVLLRLDDSGSGSGTLVEYLSDPLYPNGAYVFMYQSGVTTLGNLNTALATLSASSKLLLVTASPNASTTITAGAAAYTAGGVDYITGVLAIVGVVQDLGGSYSVVQPEQSSAGMALPRFGRNSPATTWEASINGDNVQVLLHPEDASGSYIVRYLALPARATDPAIGVSMPDGADERIVLGMARRAGVKEGGASALVQRLIMEADADLNFAAHNRLGLDGPRIRRIPRNSFPKVGSTPDFGGLSSLRFI